MIKRNDKWLITEHDIILNKEDMMIEIGGRSNIL